MLLAEVNFHGHHSFSYHVLQYHYTSFASRNRTSLAYLSTIPSAMASDKEVNSSSVLDKELSPGDRLNHQDGHFPDPEMEGLSLYEKKALLVNRELDSHGMGKYQWYIFFLCGFGYLVDLLYAQAFGLVEPAMMQEFGFGSSNLSPLLKFTSLQCNRERVREYFFFLLIRTDSWGKCFAQHRFEEHWLMLYYA